MNSHDPETFLQATLTAFDTINLVKRQNVQRVTDIFDPNTKEDNRTNVIYRDTVAYIGSGVLLIVFRIKGKRGESREKTQYAFFSDITGRYQPISVPQIIRFFKNPPKGLRLEAKLDTLVSSAQHAHSRIAIQQNRDI